MPDRPAVPLPSPELFNKSRPKPAMPSAGPAPAAGRPAGDDRPAAAHWLGADGLSDTAPPAGHDRPAAASSASAAGPLGDLLTVDSEGALSVGPDAAVPDANALIILRRAALHDEQHLLLPEATQALLSWATGSRLGTAGSTLAQALLERRRAAIGTSGRPYSRLRVRPQWRLIVGSGERANPHEIGIALHGTTGWPIIPGSSLKGLAAAWARDEGVDPDRYQHIFGHPIDRASNEDQPEGRVVFYDALPCSTMSIRVDVVNPHHRNEWTNPIPSHFLVIAGGSLELFVAADAQEDCDEALGWLKKGMDDLGVGAKTAAGYGYLTEVSTFR